MKNIKYILILTTIICIFLAFSLNSYASYTIEAKNNPIIDDADFIDKTSEAEITNALLSATDRTGVEFRVYVYDYSDSYHYIDMYDYESIVGEEFDNLVLLIVSYEFGEYYYELFTEGSANTSISDKEADKILDNENVYDNIKSGNLTAGILEYISLAETAVLGTLRNSFKSVFVPSLIISLSVAAIASISVIAIYKRKQHSPSYPLEKYARLDLNVSRDTFVNKIVTRVRVNNSSSSSSGGRSGGGGGGSRGRR